MAASTALYCAPRECTKGGTMSGPVEFEQGGVQVSGYLAEPEGTARGGLIVIQEWWGLNDDIRGIADRYAAEGYLAFAPDIYHGQLTTEPDEATKLMMSMDRDLAGRELDAVAGWLKSERGVAKVGCTGFCMGGGLALATAARPTANVDAVHAYYGVPFLTPDQLASVGCPVMCSYGGEDGMTPAEQIDGLREGLAGRNVAADIKVYERAGHSFFNAGEAHHAASAQDSWERSLKWFGEHLS